VDGYCTVQVRDMPFDCSRSLKEFAVPYRRLFPNGV
jgi:hypothetical protein